MKTKKHYFREQGSGSVFEENLIEGVDMEKVLPLYNSVEIPESEYLQLKEKQEEEQKEAARIAVPVRFSFPEYLLDEPEEGGRVEIIRLVERGMRKGKVKIDSDEDGETITASMTTRAWEQLSDETRDAIATILEELKNNNLFS